MDPALEDGPAAPRPLPAPAALRRAAPAPAALRAQVEDARGRLRDALHGRDPRRLVVIVGPCSIHDPEAALEYGTRLAALARAHDDALLVVMRTYFEKPRTTLGWTGLLRDPHLDGRGDVAEGLRRARALLVALGERGVACGGELLDPTTPAYVGDLLAWASVGARTVESQLHRQMASALAMPVGLKNTTDGRLGPALDAARTAFRSHDALVLDDHGRAALRRSAGNPDAHLVLRGGDAGPNHGGEALAEATRGAAGLGLARGVLVDCSHGNSGKDAESQPRVCREVLAAWRAGETPQLLGVMIESFLRPGRQDPTTRPLAYGVSVTDACLGWETTAELLEEIAEAARQGPAAPGPVRKAAGVGTRAGWGAEGAPL